MSRANVYASPYAIAHPEVYELVALRWQRGVPIVVQLALVGADDRVIDEDGCNCDLDAPCNNPRCVMERDLEERAMFRTYRAPARYDTRDMLDDILLDSGRDYLIRP